MESSTLKGINVKRLEAFEDFEGGKSNLHGIYAKEKEIILAIKKGNLVTYEKRRKLSNSKSYHIGDNPRKTIHGRR